jgi:hypothetical protein
MRLITAKITYSDNITITADFRELLEKVSGTSVSFGGSERTWLKLANLGR